MARREWWELPAPRVDVRCVVGIMARVLPVERERILAERRQEIADAAQELQRPALHWLAKGKDRASFLIGLAGAAWSVRGGFDPVGLVLSAAGMASQFISGRRAPVTAYSYIFAVDREFGNC